MKKRKLPKVIGFTLPVWKCKTCRRIHVERGNVAEFTDEQRAEFGAKADEAEWRMFPDVVECKKCGTEYRFVVLEPESME